MWDHDFVFLGSTVLTAFLAGSLASVSGFGIGSLLTPLLAMRLGTKLAVAVVAISHFLTTCFRFWLLRRHVDYRLFCSFGLMSAAGGLTGALLHRSVDNPVLTAVFGTVLIATGVLELLGLSEQLRLRGWKAWIAGGISGFLGGLVGNQGGIRSAALLGFDVPRQAFVATATSVGLVVDATRIPVYLAADAGLILHEWPLVLAILTGSVTGTLLGNRLLKRLPERIFRRLVGSLVIALGGMLIWRQVL